jgi:hypothetical protein
LKRFFLFIVWSQIDVPIALFRQVETSSSPPVVMAKKPKMYLTCSLSMEPRSWYKLTWSGQRWAQSTVRHFLEVPSVCSCVTGSCWKPCGTIQVFSRRKFLEDEKSFCYTSTQFGALLIYR